MPMQLIEDRQGAIALEGSLIVSASSPELATALRATTAEMHFTIRNGMLSAALFFTGQNGAVTLALDSKESLRLADAGIWDMLVRSSREHRLETTQILGLYALLRTGDSAGARNSIEGFLAGAFVSILVQEHPDTKLWAEQSTTSKKGFSLQFMREGRGGEKELFSFWAPRDKAEVLFGKDTY